MSTRSRCTAEVADRNAFGAATTRRSGAPLTVRDSASFGDTVRLGASTSPARQTDHVTSETVVLALADAAAWSEWLDMHADRSGGVWLVLAKKGTTEPTSLRYDQALEEAICHGWVDGQLARGDERTFRRRFAPRRSGSAWSERNVALARRLTEEGRMRPAGLAAVRRAEADGTWASAYAGSATMEVPADLAAALEANPAARASAKSAHPGLT